MIQIILNYQSRGWKISVNVSRQVIFREPIGVGWFCLCGCTETEANFINGYIN